MRQNRGLAANQAASHPRYEAFHLPKRRAWQERSSRSAVAVVHQSASIDSTEHRLEERTAAPIEAARPSDRQGVWALPDRVQGFAVLSAALSQLLARWESWRARPSVTRYMTYFEAQRALSAEVSELEAGLTDL